MLTIVEELSHLRAADDHLRTALYLVSAQEDRLARLRAAGLDIRQSEQLLLVMQAIFRSFLAHRRAICDAIGVCSVTQLRPPRSGIPSETQSWAAGARPKAAIDLPAA